jgi:hypothetical protein
MFITFDSARLTNPGACTAVITDTDTEVGGGVQAESSCDPQLESAWFQPLNLSSEKTGFKSLLSNGSTCTATPRWTCPSRAWTRQGLSVQLECSCHPELESAWFQPLNLEMWYPGFKVCAFSNSTLYPYDAVMIHRFKGMDRTKIGTGWEALYKLNAVDP